MIPLDPIAILRFMKVRLGEAASLQKPIGAIDNDVIVIAFKGWGNDPGRLPQVGYPRSATPSTTPVVFPGCATPDYSFDTCGFDGCSSCLLSVIVHPT